MPTARRKFLGMILPASVALFAIPRWQHSAPRVPGQGPSTPSPSQNPPDMDPNAAPTDPKKLLKGNQQKIADDVEKLYTLATELRDQVKNTDSTTVLSLALLQKAEEVEKLAHQIRTLAKA